MTPQRRFDVPEVLLSQVIPSEEVRMVPETPTATNVLFANPTPYRESYVPEILDVQDAPSDEVRIVPEMPTTTNVLFL